MVGFAKHKFVMVRVGQRERERENKWCADFILTG